MYYFDPETKASQWDKPEGATVIPLDASQQSQVKQIRACHLLVKHSGSRRPSSWKQSQITRSKEEALAMIVAFRERVVAGEVDLPTLSRTESDCSSASKGGDLGLFGKGQMQQSFEQAAFALKVNELSDPVESDSGIHLILRTE